MALSATDIFFMNRQYPGRSGTVLIDHATRGAFTIKLKYRLGMVATKANSLSAFGDENRRSGRLAPIQGCFEVFSDSQRIDLRHCRCPLFDDAPSMGRRLLKTMDFICLYVKRLQ